MNFYVGSLPGSKRELEQKAKIHSGTSAIQHQSNNLYHLSIKKASKILLVSLCCLKEAFM